MLCSSVTPQGEHVVAYVYPPNSYSKSQEFLFWTKVCWSKAKLIVDVKLSLATSAVDLDTDHAIQEIIQGPAFANVTILTIA